VLYPCEAVYVLTAVIAWLARRGNLPFPRPVTERDQL
jgi:hypothetical protein